METAGISQSKISPSLVIKNALKKFITSVEKLYGGDLDKIILFGSQARGDAGPDSDVDILIVAHNKLSLGNRDKLITVISDLAIEDNLLFNFIEISTVRFESEKSPLLLNVQKEGITLWTHQR